jgi:hypothetical protein
MELNIKVIGKMINKMVKVKKNGKMVHFILVNINKEKKKEKVNLYGEMIVHTKVIFMIIVFMVKVNIPGKMVEFMMVIGIIIKCMEKEHLYGLMVVNMKESM